MMPASDLNKFPYFLGSNQTAEELLLTTLESIGDGFLACDAEWRFVYVNSSAENMLGIQRDMVLGANLWEVFPQAAGTPLAEECRRAAAGETRDFEYFLEPGQRWFHNRCLPRPGGGLSVYFQDITDRKMEGQKRRSAEEHLRLALAAARMGAYYWDLASNEIVCSDVARTIFGISEETPSCYENWRELLLPEDLRNTEQVIDQAIKGSGDLEGEYRIKWPDGSVHWISVRGRFVYGPDGAARGMHGVCQDFTERKQVEEKIRQLHADLEQQVVERTAELRDKEERLRSIVDTVSDCIWEIDEQHRFTFISSRFFDLTGYQPEEFLGKTPQAFLDLKVLENLEDEYYSVIGAGRSEFISSFLIRHHNEKMVFVEIKTVPVFSKTGRYMGARGITRDITERKQAENEVLRLKNHYQMLFDSSPDAYLIIEKESSRISNCNQSALRMLKGTRSQILGLTPDRLLPPWQPDGTPSSLEAVKIKIAETLQNGGHRFEWMHRRLTGEDFWVDVTLKIMEMDDREVVFAVWRDIDAQKRLEQSVAVHTQRLERTLRALNAVGIGVYRVESETGRIIESDSVYANRLGYRPEELVGMPVNKLQFGDSEEEFPQALEMIGEAGVFPYKHFLCHKDGRVLPTLLIACLEKEGPEDAGQFIVFALDESRFEALQSENTYLRLLLDASPDFVGLAPLGQLLAVSSAPRVPAYNEVPPYLNSGARTLLGLPDSVRAADLNLCRVHTDQAYRQAVDVAVPIALETGFWRGESEILAYGGESIPVDQQIFILNDRDSRAHYIGTIIRDLRDFKAKEAELILARQAADAANIAKSEFLANMSHEIRTPLNGIMGMAKFLEYTPLNREQKECLQVIQSSSESLLMLINNILDLAKVESGRMELEIRDFSLRASIAEIVQTQISLAHNKGLRVVADIPAGVPDDLTGDQVRLKQILLNLLGNAIKFTARGEIRIAAAVPESIGDQVLLRMSISDTGIGIPAELLTRIFQPFVQADSSTTRHYGGTGLGLAICRRMVDLMGGKIWATSEVGAGSTFYLELPFASGQESARKNEERKAGLIPAGWSGTPLRILLVDDDESNRKAAVRMLRLVGHTVRESPSGEDALRQLEQDPFDLVLMDIQMPGMSGIDVLHAIRQKEKEGRPTVPVLALTARVLLQEQERIRKEGFQGYIPKPMDMDRLFREIRRCTEKEAPSSAAGAVPPVREERRPIHDVDRDRLAPILAEMEEMLKMNRLNVIDWMEELDRILPESDSLAAMRQQVRKFNFSRALEHLAEIFSKYGIPRQPDDFQGKATHPDR